MKKSALMLLSVGLLFSMPSYSGYNPSGKLGPASTDETATYLKNLATYFGYDVETQSSPFASALLDYTLNLATKGQQMMNVFFAARPVNPSYSTFVTTSPYSNFNAQANILFGDSFATAASDKTTGVSVVPNFDQKTYRKDPTDQAITNILVNPNITTCQDSDSSDATCLSQSKVMSTVLQDIMDENNYLPSEYTYYTPAVVNTYVSQLNFNTLLGPLMYSTTGSQALKGLPAANQEQQAMNFIRYVTNAVMPVDSMSQSDYNTMWTNAHTEIVTGMSSDQITTIQSARQDLAKYLLKTRVYAAQNSLPISNFYNSMESRMPQTNTSTNKSTSQSLNDFVMATWRLYDPSAQTGSQWVDKINTASAATTQKEIAILLSEINYQLYLSRQTQERALLTDSLIALALLGSSQPINVPTTSLPAGVAGGDSGDTPPPSS